MEAFLLRNPTQAQRLSHGILKTVLITDIFLLILLTILIFTNPLPALGLIQGKHGHELPHLLR